MYYFVALHSMLCYGVQWWDIPLLWLCVSCELKSLVLTCVYKKFLISISDNFPFFCMYFICLRAIRISHCVHRWGRNASCNVSAVKYVMIYTIIQVFFVTVLQFGEGFIHLIHFSSNVTCILLNCILFMCG